MNASFSTRKSYQISRIVNLFRTESRDIIRILFYDMMPIHSGACSAMSFFEGIKTLITYPTEGSPNFSGSPTGGFTKQRRQEHTCTGQN